MKRFISRGLTGCLAISSILLAFQFARATDMADFKKMSKQDQDAFLSFLIKDTVNALKSDGSPELAGQIDSLFSPRDKESPGSREFVKRLQLEGESLARYQKEGAFYSLQWFTVEGVFLRTLSANGIHLPEKYSSLIQQDFNARKSSQH